jgi:hypothetical protein
MKVSYLEGALLDYWVAKAGGYSPMPHDGHWFIGLDRYEAYNPSANWALAGPIIEREKITLIHYGIEDAEDGNPWEAAIRGDCHYIDQYPGDAMGGPTALIAAMRRYVESKYGDEVDG